jgi:hypothetical protein
VTERWLQRYAEAVFNGGRGKLPSALDQCRARSRIRRSAFACTKLLARHFERSVADTESDRTVARGANVSHGRYLKEHLTRTTRVRKRVVEVRCIDQTRICANAVLSPYADSVNGIVTARKVLAVLIIARGKVANAA